MPKNPAAGSKLPDPDDPYRDLTQLESLDVWGASSTGLIAELVELGDSAERVTLSSSQVTSIKDFGTAELVFARLPAPDALLVFELALEPELIRSSGVNSLKATMIRTEPGGAVWKLSLLASGELSHLFEQVRASILNIHVLFYLDPSKLEFPGFGKQSGEQTQGESGATTTPPETPAAPAVEEAEDSVEPEPQPAPTPEPEPSSPETPRAEPTPEPSETPSPEPTAEPSASPSPEPEPSLAPSPEPEESPSPEPSTSPSPEP